MIRIFFLIATLAVLTACSSLPISSLDSALYHDDKGIVNIAITSNFPDIDQFRAIEVRQMSGKGTGQERVVSALNIENNLNTNLFSFQLEPGQYQIISVRTNANADGYMYCKIGDRYPLGFSVEQNRITDLGAIALVRIGTGTCHTLRDQQITNVSKEIAHAWPSYSSKVKVAPDAETLGWDDKPAPYEALGLYIAKRVTPTVHNPVLTADGYLLAGSELGQVLIRSPQGRWNNVSMDTLNTIMFVTPVGDDLVMSGELNTFILIKDKQQRKIDTSGLPELPIVYVDYHPRVGLLAFFQGDQSIQVYMTESVENPQWQHFSSIASGQTFWGYHNTIFKTIGSTIYIATTPKSLYLFDVNNKSWSKQELPCRVENMSVSDMHEIIVYGSDGWNKINYLSVDAGINWEPLNKKTVDSLAHVSADGSIIMNVGGNEPKIMQTTDRGENWTEQRSSKSGELFVKGNIELIFGSYEAANIGNLIFVYVEKDGDWFWERNTYYNYNRERIIKELEKRFGKKEESKTAI